MISYEEFSKVELRVGKIISAEPVPKSDKLLKLSVDFGLIPQVPEPAGEIDEDVPVGTNSEPVPESREIRQILSGIAKYFPDASSLVGKKCMFVTNLAPRMMMGMESNGMILAVSTDDGRFSLLEPNDSIPEGTKAK
ncbi:MAG TPA: methionine--tRNA ligase subunit beta [Candidatus Paceibacterota bacterium]|jgi:methionyl-tRNA synthetase|nr:methionine--tRNA ligase subunit beta [Candidatus Paceibacterota bacterium]